MFLKPSGEVKSELNEISRTRKQFVRERNVNELAIIELTEDLRRVDKEVVETRQRLELLEEQAAAKWTTIVEARTREGTLIRQVEEAESNLRRKTQEYKQWQILWEELPHTTHGSQRSGAFYGKILNKCGVEALEAKTKSLLEVDLVGGYYDAGDNVKFGLPMAFTITMMLWSIVEYGKQMAASGELGDALEVVKWGTDYLIKAHPKPNILKKQAPLTVKQEKFCNDACVERFLKSKGDNVKKAAKHLRSCLSWRESIWTEHLIADEFSAELADGVACVAGHDQEARPVMVLRIKQDYQKFHS